MATVDEILLHFQGVDNVTPTAQQIDQSLNGMMGNATAQGGGLINTMSRLGGIFQGLNGLVMGAFGAYGLSTFKNMTYGMATAREEVKGLYESVAGSTEDASSEASQLWEYMDELTNHGYVQLDDLTQAMNVFGMSTASGVEGMKIAVDMVNDIGNRAIQMGYDSNRQQLLMQSVAQGLNGNMRMLNVAFGITKDKLKALGWSGQANDIQGYIDAIDEYLNKNVKMDNLLDSTKGRVVALQKRFRIAGRNLGNYMLPPINAIMDGFTQLNAQSNDLMASLIIIGTGAMSGFASILPTLAPLIQVYQFLDDTLGKHNINLSIGNKLTTTSNSRFKGLTNSIKGTTSSAKEFVAIPILNWLRSTISLNTQWIRTPVNAFLDSVHLRLGNVNKRLVAFAVSTKATVLSPFNSALSRMSGLLGDVTKKLAGFILNYGKLSTAESLVPKLMERGHDIKDLASPERAKKLRPAEALFKSKLFTKDRDAKREVQRTEALTKAYLRQTKALSTHTLIMQANNIAQGEGILMSEGKTAANTDEAISEDISTFAKIRNTIATWANTAGEEAGIGAKIWAIAVNLKDAAVKKIVSIWNTIVAITQMEILLPLLLIIGAIITLIAIIDQIGKTLGWWDNWKEMLDAIVKGLQRIWQAFINNPNVQGFIKDIQWVFGQLGGTIQWVAWQVLQFFGWKDDGGEVDIVRGIIDVFGALGDILGKIVNAVKYFFKVTAPIWNAIFTVISIPVRAIIGLLRGIICIILGCSPGIVPALLTVRDTFRKIFGEMANFINDPIGTIIRVLQLWQKMLFNVAKNIGLSIWNGLNSILGGIPQKVWQIFWNMLTNIKQIPQMIWGTAQDIGQQAYNGLDSAVSGLTGGLVHLPGATNGQNAQQNAKTMGNATKNYNNSRNMNRGHTINIGAGAIQLDARNLTTKESKQIMINALEGLTTYETVHTKKAQGKGK